MRAHTQRAHNAHTRTHTQHDIGRRAQRKNPRISESEKKPQPHTQTQTYTDTDTKTDAHPERRSMIEEGGSRKKSSREVKGDRCQKEEVTLDHHWMS